MKIISRFRDYYDSVSHQYLDKQIIYKRETTKIVFGKNQYESMPIVHADVRRLGVFSSNIQRAYDVSLQIVGFCGELYPVVVLEDDLETHNFYNLKDLKDFLQSKKINISEKKRWLFYSHRYDLDNYLDYKRFFEEKDKFDVLRRFFQDKNVPIFSYLFDPTSREHILVLNPPLKAYDFMKVRDPYLAHQELYMWACNFMAKPERPMVKISDEDKIAKRGFDKWSFRKMPTKKKNEKKK